MKKSKAFKSVQWSIISIAASLLMIANEPYQYALIAVVIAYSGMLTKKFIDQ